MNSEQEQLLYEIAQRTARMESSIKRMEADISAVKVRALEDNAKQDERLNVLEQTVSSHETLLHSGLVLLAGGLGTILSKLMGWF